MDNIMLDAETLAVTADAVIMSIGAVKFNIESGEIDDAGFYASVSVESNQAMKRRITDDTLIWWLKQPPAAQAVFSEPKQTLESALADLSDFFDHENYKVWSDGASFDIPMIEHAYRQHNMDSPWVYSNARCLRTLKTMPFAKGVQKPTRGVGHNALHDAINQAAYASAIWAAMKKVSV